VRIVGWETERLVDAFLQLFRECVLEPFRFAVHFLYVDAKRLRQIELEQAVVPDDLERHLLAGIRECNASVGLVNCEPERCELLHHRAGRRRRDALPFGQCRHGDAAGVYAELVDLAQIVLNRV